MKRRQISCAAGFVLTIFSLFYRTVGSDATCFGAPLHFLQTGLSLSFATLYYFNLLAFCVDLAIFSCAAWLILTLNETLRSRPLVHILALALILVVGMLVLFPPWYTIISGNGYPRIDFHWIGSRPLPIGEFDYRVDLERLVTRIAVVIPSLAVAAYGVMKILRLRLGDQASR